MMTAPTGATAGPRAASPGSLKLLVALVIVLAGAAAWDLYLSLRPLAPPSAEIQSRVAALLLFDAARAIEAHRSSSGSLPSDLAPLRLPRAEYHYARADTGYTVTVRVSELSASYRSGDDVWSLLQRAGVR
jgi:hypothetical protein